MAIAAAVANKTSGWTMMFPTEILSELQSLVFVKKLFAVAVSHILYNRSLFPDGAFFDKQLEGIRLKILREDNCARSSKVVFWLRGCFDAIDRKFLRSATLSLCNNPGNKSLKDITLYNVVESYCFKFLYEDGSTSVNINSGEAEMTFKPNSSQENIKRTTCNLLKTISLAGERLKCLEGSMFLTMKLTYYDDVTPDDYVPPGFRSATEEEFEVGSESLNLRVGEVRTDFHSIKMHIQTRRDALPHDSKALVGRKSPITDAVKQLPQSQVSSKSGLSPPSETEAEKSQEFTVCCPCGVNRDDGIMILCDGCSSWQHAVCFRILEDADVPKVHICDKCAVTKPELLVEGGVTDRTLENLNEDARRTLCLFRRVLFLCLSTDLISVPIIAKSLEIETTVARGLFNRLVKQQVLKDNAGKRGEKLVQKEFLETQILPEAFQVGCIENVKASYEVVNLSNETGQMTLRHTPRKRPQLQHTSPKVEDIQLSILSQESNSPIQTTKRRKRGVANTPILVSRL